MTTDSAQPEERITRADQASHATVPVRIAPDVYEILLPAVRVHLIAEHELTLIDAGIVRSGGRIQHAMTALGRSPDELRRIVCTHCHPDHAGGAVELLSDRVDLLMHPADLERVAVTIAEVLRRPTRGRLFAALTRAPSRGVPVNDGDVLPVLGGLHVIHAPGHTPGSICLFAPRDGVLFVGDALQARFGRVGFASRLYSDDFRVAKAQVQRLAELDVDTIVFSHFPPWRRDARRVLQDLAARVEA